MTFRITSLALAALLIVGAGCSESGGSNADISSLDEMDAFDQFAYAAGFETAQGLKRDSALLRRFDYDMFAEGVRDGLAGDSSRVAYMTGYQLGSQLKRDTVSRLNPDIFLAAFREGLDSDSSRLTDDRLQEITLAVQDSIQMRQLRARAVTDTTARRRLQDMRTNEAAAQRFLAEVAQRDGVTKTASGLLYSIESTGEGESPTEDDVVVVNYVGKLAERRGLRPVAGRDGDVLAPGRRAGLPRGHPRHEGRRQAHALPPARARLRPRGHAGRPDPAERRARLRGRAPRRDVAAGGRAGAAAGPLADALARGRLWRRSPTGRRTAWRPVVRFGLWRQRCASSRQR